MAWRMAFSLNRLLTQINELAPGRSKLSDGGIADEHHPTSSDHSPHRFPWAAAPLVLARDITHDPAGGLDCHRLRDALVRSRDPRIAYIIWNGQITAGAAGPQPWTARPYTGRNRHDKHLHLSVVRDGRADSVAAWDLQSPDWDLTAKLPVLRHGDRSEAVRRLQEFLVRAFPTYAQFEPTGFYGDQTKGAVREFQRRAGVHGSPLDGSIVGPATNYELAKHGYRG